MKYSIHTFLTGFFFVMVFAWIAMTNTINSKDVLPDDGPVISKTDSMEIHSIMRLLMIDIHTINEGIYTQNFGLIEKGAYNINDHPPLSSESLQLVKETLGERMSQFSGYDKVVHDTADSLRNAAVNEDMERIRDYYHIIEQGCVSCHHSFQKEIRVERLKSAVSISDTLSDVQPSQN